MIRALAEYWVNDYDWRRCEARLNALPQFKTEIDGVDVHFIHVKSRHEEALPLMTHGWPGSVIEMLDTVGPLTDPTEHGGRAEDAFDLVLPSVPGYGFSAEPGRGWLGSASHRTGLGRADAPSRLHPLCRPGRRRGRRRHRRDQPPGTAGPDRRPYPTCSCRRSTTPRPCRRPPSRNRRRSPRSKRSTSGDGYFVEQAAGPRPSATRCWTPPSHSRRGWWTTTPTPTTRSRAPSPTTSRRATSPATTSSTTSRPTG